MHIIGVVGPLACGKGVVAEHLIKHKGYISFSLSSIVHDELKKKGVTNFTRTTLQDIGDMLRKNEGDGALAKRAVSILQKKGVEKVVIEGIRNPGEVAYLRTLPGFFLIAIDSRRDLRYKRVIQRGKPWDPKNWKSFEQVDCRDQGDTKNKSGQQVQACMSLADVKIENNNSIEELKKEIEMVLSKRSF